MFWELKRIWLDLRAGTCSGFPKCCVLSYVTIWRMIYGSSAVSISKKSALRMRLIFLYHRFALDAGYVPCPLCIISGARVEIKKCTELCGHNEESRIMVLEKHPHAFGADS